MSGNRTCKAVGGRQRSMVNVSAAGAGCRCQAAVWGHMANSFTVEFQPTAREIGKGNTSAFRLPLLYSLEEHPLFAGAGRSQQSWFQNKRN